MTLHKKVDMIRDGFGNTLRRIARHENRQSAKGNRQQDEGTFVIQSVSPDTAVFRPFCV